MQHRATQLTVGRLFAQRARIRGRDAALTFKGRTISYAELNSQSNRIAHFLKSLSVQRGDRIAVLSENRPEFRDAADCGGQARGCRGLLELAAIRPGAATLLGPGGATSSVFASPRFEERLSALDEAKPAQRLILATGSSESLSGLPRCRARCRDGRSRRGGYLGGAAPVGLLVGPKVRPSVTVQ